VFFFKIRYLKGHLLVFDVIVTFFLLAKVPQHLAGIERIEVKLFCVIINQHVKQPLIIAWAILEFNGIVRVFVKIQSKVFRDSNQL